MSSKPLIRSITLFSLLALTSACGYNLVGVTSILPEDIEAFYIPTFQNETGQPELEQRLTNAVANEFVARGRYRVSATVEEADAVLKGTIKTFGLSPMALDVEGRATDYMMTITLSVELYRKGEEEPLWANPAFTFRERYTVGTVALDYYDRLFQAVDELSQTFAQTLITSILEGF